MRLNGPISDPRPAIMKTLYPQVKD